jgi:hypothetical protein
MKLKTKIMKDKYGYEKGYYTPKAKNSKIVYITQTGKYRGFTAEVDTKNPYKPKYLGHGMSAEKLARRYAKKYKYVRILD